MILLAAVALAQAQVPQNPCEALETTNMSREQTLALISCVNREAARQLSQGLPSRVDELTTLIGVIAAGPTLVYSMRIDALRESFSTEEIARRENRVRSNVCDTPGMRMVINYGGAYQYIWLDREGRRMHSFAIESCPSVR